MLRREKQKSLPTFMIYEDPNFDHRFDLAVAGAQLFVKDRILTKITAENLIRT
jgi:hypothetical protein